MKKTITGFVAGVFFGAMIVALAVEHAHQSKAMVHERSFNMGVLYGVAVFSDGDFPKEGRPNNIIQAAKTNASACVFY